MKHKCNDCKKKIPLKYHRCWDCYENSFQTECDESELLLDFDLWEIGVIDYRKLFEE